jgi:hypothetical protein
MRGVLLTLSLLTAGCGPSFRYQCLLEVTAGIPEAAQVGTALHLGEASDAALGIVKGVVRWCDELDAMRQATDTRP